MQFLESVLAPVPIAADPAPVSPLVQFVPFILILLLFYFLFWAPMRRKQKKHAEMLENLKPGDKVITNGGIYGTIVAVGDMVVQLRVADGVKIEVAKQAIAGLQAPREG